MKEDLFELKLALASTNKTSPWTMNQLEFVLKNLKNGKSRDPKGWVNELFKSDIAGEKLKVSMLMMFNKIKEKNCIPDFMRQADIVAIYKKKGDKSDLNNDRGIFLVSIFRSILMKLIYIDTYPTIDKNMSDSQVGARKNKNVRNHSWIVNGVISDVLHSKKKVPIDLQIFDYKQCFDSLWLEECVSDLYDSGVKDDNLALLYNVNSHVKIAVKTPVGKTKRESIFNVITQGDVFGPILCSNQVDTFGKECLEEEKYVYSYKGSVDIPPLGMVDDLICITECGHKTAMMNSYINFKTNSKKLQFGVSKCKKLHVGSTRFDYKCCELKVDKWSEKIIKKRNRYDWKIEDIPEDQFIMELVSEEKYLGDVTSSDGKNLKNVKIKQEFAKELELLDTSCIILKIRQ